MVRIDQGEDILEKIKELCEKEKINLGRVEAIGATDQAAIGVYDMEKKEYYLEKIMEFMEITNLSGNITTLEGKPYIHLHATLADRYHHLHGGHVIEMKVLPTCEMFISVFEGNVNRKKDEESGINLWSF